MSDTPKTYVSDTPETDEATFDGSDGQGWEVVSAEVARKLERERNKAREALREIKVADWKTSRELQGIARRALEAVK